MKPSRYLVHPRSLLLVPNEPDMTRYLWMDTIQLTSASKGTRLRKTMRKCGGKILVDR